MVRVTLLGQTTARANRLEQERLGLSAADMVLRITRVRYREQQRLALETVVLPLKRFPLLARNGESTPDVAELARRPGLTLGRGRERASVVRAGRRVVAQLRVRKGARMQKLDRVIATADGTPIEWRISFLTPSQ